MKNKAVYWVLYYVSWSYLAPYCQSKKRFETLAEAVKYSKYQLGIVKDTEVQWTRGRNIVSIRRAGPGSDGR